MSTKVDLDPDAASRNLFAGMTVADYSGLFQGDHAAGHHLIDGGHDGIYFFLIFHNLYNDGQIGGETKKFVCMEDAVRSESGNPPQHRDAGESLFFEKFNQVFVEGAVPDFIVFAEEYAHQYLFAAEPCHDYALKLEIACRMDAKPGEGKTDHDTHQDVDHGDEKFPALQQSEGLIAEGGKCGKPAKKTDG